MNLSVRPAKKLAKLICIKYQYHRSLWSPKSKKLSTITKLIIPYTQYK